MKYLITTIAAVVLVGCGESQESAAAPEAKPVEPVAEVPAQPSPPPVEAKPDEPVAEESQPEPPAATAPEISIHEAAGEGNIEAVKQHLAAGTDVNARYFGVTPLHASAGVGHKEIVELLIAEGADVNAGVNRNDEHKGKTPLDAAIGEGNTATADLLRKHGGKTGEEFKAEAQPTIDLGYYCLSCKKTENITAYRDDFPNNWRQYPGGGSDSVLYCIKCKKGKAHPVNDCKICGTVFILHLFPKYDEYGDPSCPKCDTAYGNMAKSRGIDLMPKELKAEGK